MARAAFLVTGDRRVAAKLERLSRQARGRTLLRAAAAGGLLVANEAKRRARYRTGNLRRSIHVGGFGGREQPTTGTDIGGAETTRTSATVSIGTNVVYAKIIERRYPFLRPATQATKRQVAREIAAALRDLLRAQIR